MFFINDGQEGFILSCLFLDLVISGGEAMLEYIGSVPAVDESHGREMFSKVIFKLCVWVCVTRK